MGGPFSVVRISSSGPSSCSEDKRKGLQSGSESVSVVEVGSLPCPTGLRRSGSLYDPPSETPVLDFPLPLNLLHCS